MHARELIELAAVICSADGSLQRGGHHFCHDGLAAYWSASRQRLDLWNRALKPLWSTDPVEHPQPDEALSLSRAALEEVLASDVLTRVWAAVLSGGQPNQSPNSAVSIGRSVFLAHQEMRRRVLTLMAAGQQSQSSALRSLNQLRCRCERWNDLLLARVTPQAETEAYAYDQARLRDFIESYHGETECGASGRSWPIFAATLRGSLRGVLTGPACCPQSNLRIASAVLTSLRPAFGDSADLLRSSWLARMECVSEDARDWVAEYLCQALPAGNKRDSHWI